MTDGRPGLPAGGQTRRLALSGGKGLIGRCRDFTRAALTDWQWIPADPADASTDAGQEQLLVVEDVLLLVSELVTNACLHAGGPEELTLHCTDERLRVEVADPSPTAPSPRRSRPALPGGHGLHVVERLSRNWGSASRGSGKTVWLEVASPLRAAVASED